MAQQKLIDLDKIPVFLPISFIVIFWEFLVLIFILWDFVLTIMVQCFEPDYLLQDILYNYIDNILVAILVLDIIFTFNICYIKKGVVIFQRKEIAINYVKSIYFWVDIGSLIIAILQLIFNSSANYSTAYNFIVFIKVIKAYELDKNIKRYALKSFNALLFYQIAKNVIFLALICHILGCFFYYIDYVLIQQNAYPTTGPNPNPYWLIGSSAYPYIINQNLWVKYCYCFYFSTSLLSGVAYGDLVPQNPTQTLYVTFVLLFPLVIYSYIFNSIFNVISKKRQKNRLIKKYQLITKRYLRTLRVKKTLETKLITYLSFIFKKTTSNDQFIDLLAPSAKKQYTDHTIRSRFDFAIFDQMLSIAPLVSRQQFEEELMPIIHQQTFPQRYKLILPPTRFKLYYINQGVCKRVASKIIMKYSDQFSKKQYFCYYPFLTGLFNQRFTYESASFVVAQSIDRVALLILFKRRDFYQLKQSFMMMKDQKILYNNSTIDGQLCFFCNSSAHVFQHCPLMRPKIDFHTHQKKTFTKSVKNQNTLQIQKRHAFFRNTLSSLKVILKERPLDQKQQQQSTFCSIQIQCEEDYLISPKQKNKNPIQIASSFTIYYPQYNLFK